ncbi:MAG: LPXTG cell wall anchor domain-containing protein [Chitinophagales bacterium]|nr:LPXTG cell wall anchor domain-containing protein [Chitinophagales bacterium]
MANENIRGVASFGQNEIFVGQLFYLDIEVKTAKNIKVQLPSIAPDVHGLEKVKESSINGEEVLNSGDSLIYKTRFAYVAYDSVSGDRAQIAVPYSQNNHFDTLMLYADGFQVQRIAVDTTDALRKAYGPLYTVPSTNWNIYLILALIAFVLVIIGGLYYWKRKKSQLSIPIDKNPRQWAYEQLIDLEGRIPFVKEKKDWALLSDILRLYMERAWSIPAPFFSTGEVLGVIANSQKYSSQLVKISEVLTICDHVKFAKQGTSEDEQKVALQKVRELIGFDGLADSDNMEVKNE